MNNKESVFENWVLAKYYIFAALFQTIWSVAVLGFIIFLVCHFDNYWVLLGLIMIFLKPYTMLNCTRKSNIESKTSKYGTNEPPT